MTLVASILGVKRKIKGRMDFDKLIREGLQYSAILRMKESLKLTEQELSDILGVSPRTLIRYKEKGKRFSPVESDRAYRYAKIFAYAANVFGGEEGAREWLHIPQMGLGGRIPLDMMKTEAGAQEVEDLLGRIEYGVVL